MNSKVRKILDELRQRLQSLYGPRLVRVILFGSQARGDAAQDSDIDVLVVLDGEVHPGQEIQRTGQIMADLSLENDVVISSVFVSAERFVRERSPLLINIRSEGVNL